MPYSVRTMGLKMKSIDYKKLKVVFIALTLFLPFQNCGSPMHSGSQNTLSSLGTREDLNLPTAYGKTGLRRLTRNELVNSLTSVFGVAPGAATAGLADDIVAETNFDNDYTAQAVSPIVVNGYAYFADTYAAQLIATAGLVQNLAGCVPRAANDRACFTAFATNIGRLMFRRPISATEVGLLADRFIPYAAADAKFLTGIEMAIMYWLQHPEFLYRIEASASPTTLTSLGDFEIASRMSFLLWGSSPDDELLDAAEAGLLQLESHRTEQALRMLDDDRAKRQVRSFHAQWLGYVVASLPAGLAQDMTRETDALIDRVALSDAEPWLNLFTAQETFLSPTLASHYGMPSPGSSAQWVQYPSDRGGGILAHGRFLSLGAKFGDTSPTVRGYEMYKRLACGKLGPIPNGVDTDSPPGQPGDCKTVRYSMRNVAACATCHITTDNTGFGLENFSPTGQWRTTEPGKPQCTITGEGKWAGVAYSGPKGLGQLISKDALVANCATRQLFRNLAGRPETPEDNTTLAALGLQYQATPNLKKLLIALVKTPAITYRRGE